jgi:lipopolysaccharide export system permease protein
MLFDSSIRKELARSFGATLVVLITVVMTMMLIRTLGQAAGQRQPFRRDAGHGLHRAGPTAHHSGPEPFVAIVGTLSRMYRDSEMVIWFASGQGLASLLRPLLRFAWPVMLAVACWRWWCGPGPTSRSADRDQFEQRSDVDRIAPASSRNRRAAARVLHRQGTRPHRPAMSSSSRGAKGEP